MQSLVHVDPQRCEQVATVLRSAPIPVSSEEFSRSGMTDDVAGNFLLIAVSICHQTQNLCGTVQGHWMRGWDYLVATLARAVRNDTFSLRPLDWIGLTDDNVMLLFQSEDGKTTLTEPGVRASLIRDIGSVMSGEGWTSLRDLYRLSCQKALSGGNAFFVSLERFRAYRDPVRKKSLYLGVFVVSYG